MHMCVDVNKNTLLSGKNVFYFTNTHTHTYIRCPLSQHNAYVHRNVPHSSVFVCGEWIAVTTLECADLVEMIITQVAW